MRDCGKIAKIYYFDKRRLSDLNGIFLHIGVILKNLVVKTALFTIGGLIALCLILWGLFSWLAPSVMVSIADGLGMDKSAASYSVSVYEKSGKIDDLTSVVERNYFCGKYKVSAKYGEMLLNRDDFLEYSLKISGGKQYVSGMTAVSFYKIGDSDKALKIASDNTAGEFKKFNGLERLLDSAIACNDSQTVSRIKDSVSKIALDGNDVEAVSHREYIIGVCDDFLKTNA